MKISIFNKNLQMEKRVNKYRITLELIETAKGETGIHEPLHMEFDNHDDIFSIVKRMQEKNPFQNQQQAAEFAIGIKMFSEVMLKNKNLRLFEELGPAYGSFIKKLKGKGE